METYKILRCYAPHLNRDTHIVRRGLTLQEAKAHCKDPETREAGVWFDCYEAEQ